MEYLALYRKYRPTTFENLIGQDHIVKTLVNQIENNRLGHAYLFTGTRGTGKTTVAKIFARAINCSDPKNGSPCGKCEVCRSLLDPSNIDVVEIDAASNNGVNEIRDLREKVQYPPVSCKYKVYIIDEVHMLTTPAFNALLKTLEEPPKHAVFILATTEAHKIPATILSRCMRFDFRLVETDKIVELISKIYDEQGKKYDKEAVYAIAKAGEGSVRDALSIADTALSYSNSALSYDDVMDILGSSNRELTLSFIKELISGSSNRVLEIINDMCKLGKSIGVLIKDIKSIVRDMIVAKTCDDGNKILQLPTDRFNKLKEITETTTLDRLIRILEIYSDAENNLRYTLNQRVIFETASLKASRPEVDYNFDALLSRISVLEKKIKEGAIVTDNSFSEQPLEEVNVQVKKKLNELTDSEVLGKIFAYLRHNGAEMLWNVMQSVKIKITQNAVTIIANNNGDKEIIEKASNVSLIESSLSEFGDVAVLVTVNENEKNMEKIDVEIEKMKKIFGDDIVIVKD